MTVCTIHHLLRCFKALAGVDNRFDATPKSLRPVSLLHLFLDPIRAGAFKQAAVWSVRRCEIGRRHQVGLEAGPVVVPVLRVDLHRLDVERCRGFDQLSKTLWNGDIVEMKMRRVPWGSRGTTCGTLLRSPPR